MRTLCCLLLLALATGCATDRLVQQADDLERRNRELEAELRVIADQFPELRARCEAALQCLQSIHNETIQLSGYDPRLGQALSNVRNGQEVLMREIAEIRGQAADMDRNLRRVYDKARDASMASTALKTTAWEVKNQMDVAGAVAGLLGVAVGIPALRGGGSGGSPAPTQSSPPPTDGGSNPWAWALGLGVTACTGGGLWAWNKFGRKPKAPGGAAPGPFPGMPGGFQIPGLPPGGFQVQGGFGPPTAPCPPGQPHAHPPAQPWGPGQPPGFQVNAGWQPMNAPAPEPWASPAIYSQANWTGPGGAGQATFPRPVKQIGLDAIRSDDTQHQWPSP